MVEKNITLPMFAVFPLFIQCYTVNTCTGIGSIPFKKSLCISSKHVACGDGWKVIRSIPYSLPVQYEVTL